MKIVRSTLFAALSIFLAGCGQGSKHTGPDSRITVTTTSFETVVAKATNTVILDFWAPWCGPCRMMDPIFAEAAARNTNIVFGKVNVDEETLLAQRFEVRAIPTLIVFKNGTSVRTNIGYQGKEELQKIIDETAAQKN